MPGMTSIEWDNYDNMRGLGITGMTKVEYCGMTVLTVDNYRSLG